MNAASLYLISGRKGTPRFDQIAHERLQHALHGCRLLLAYTITEALEKGVQAQTNGFCD